MKFVELKGLIMKILRSKYLRLLWLPLILVPSAWLISCAHQSRGDRALDEKVRNEESVELGGGVAYKSHEMITNSNELTEEQKSKLLQLHREVAAEVAKSREETGKLKMVFFRSLLDPKSKAQDLTKIKNRILALDKNKTNKMLSAMEEAQKILGRKSIDDEKFYRALMMERIGDDHRP